MRAIVKSLIRFLKIGSLLRQARMFLWNVFDFQGALIFALGRVFGKMTKVKPFEASQVKKILIIRLDRIGDLILSTPAIRAVRQRFPAAEIHLLVNSYTWEIVANNSNVNRILVYKKDTIERNYDLALSLQPGLERNHLAFLSGARWRAGYRGWGGAFYLTHPVPDDRQIRIRHEVESALEIVGLFGCATDNKELEVSISAAGRIFADNFYKDFNLKAPVVVIHPGSRQEYIRWSKIGFAVVGDMLAQKNNASVILTGSLDEEPIVREVASLMKEKAILAIGLSLEQLIAVIAKSGLFIGNSTGPMHIAAAAGVPVAAIFGCRHPLDSYLEWGPWSKRSVVVTKDLSCGNCHPSDCPTFACMKAITAQDVYDAAVKLL